MVAAWMGNGSVMPRAASGVDEIGSGTPSWAKEGDIGAPGPRTRADGFSGRLAGTARSDSAVGSR